MESSSLTLQADSLPFEALGKPKIPHKKWPLTFLPLPLQAKLTRETQTQVRLYSVCVCVCVCVCVAQSDPRAGGGDPGGRDQDLLPPVGRLPQPFRGAQVEVWS